MPDRIQFTFLGQTYDLKANDPDVDVEEVVSYVEGKIREFEREYSKLPPHKILVLAVLNMGKDYIMARNRLGCLSKEMEKKTRRLLGKIESVLEEK